MNAGVFKAEGAVTKFSKKETKGRGRCLEQQALHIRGLFTVQWWGGVGEAWWKMIQKKKKKRIHQLRI